MSSLYKVGGGSVHCAAMVLRLKSVTHINNLKLRVLTLHNVLPTRALPCDVPKSLQATAAMSEGSMVADIIAAVASIDPVMGGVDR